MRSADGVFVTDGVNRHSALLPIEELVASMERPLQNAIECGIPPGMPLNIDHDKCRPAGWSVPAGVYLARDRARQLGSLFTPDTDDERKQIQALIRRFEIGWITRAIEPHREALDALARFSNGHPIQYWHVEGSGCIAPRIAATACAQFFEAKSDLVDKHGLVDYAALLNRTVQINPGVFHEPELTVVLFAHPYFRRSLSRRNSLNSYALRSFHEAASASDMRPRLRLDPDLIGVATDGRYGVVELEYWHGPKFDDSIEAIPSGVAEHKDDSGSGIDRTQIWWKDPETRLDAEGLSRQYRTFEVEELIETPSPGIGDDHYGCRYAHAEYDLEAGTISHFDGAIRAYSTEAFLERIDHRIDRAGKNSLYAKVFRLDGPLPVQLWKRVLTDFYRGNVLIPEYLGAPPEGIELERDVPAWADARPALPALSAYLALDVAAGDLPAKISLLPDQYVAMKEDELGVAEIGYGRVAETMRQWVDRECYATISGQLAISNLAKIMLPGDAANEGAWDEVAGLLSSAIADEWHAENLSSVSVAVGWRVEDVSVTLSVGGQADLVAELLEVTRAIVLPNALPSAWIEMFRDKLWAIAPDLDAPVDWPRSAIRFRRIALERAGEVDTEIMFPADMADRLRAVGD